MRRFKPLAIATLVLALLGGASDAAAAKSGSAHGLGPASFAVFELPAGEGLTALLEHSVDTTTLWIASPTQFNAYRVRGKVAAGRLSARFGGLGSLSLRFKPKKTLPVERPGGRCGGLTTQTELGVFTGTIHFAGEGGYSHVDASRVPGEVLNPIRYDCGSPPPTVGHSSHRTIDERALQLIRLEREAEGGHAAVLQASSGPQALTAISVDRPPSRAGAYLFAGGTEEAGGVKILRGGAVKAPPTAFQLDLAAGTATLAPPFPFSGGATLQRNPDGTSSWSGDLSLSVLGGGSVPLTGAGFRAFLAKDFPD
jgi:hypothetical protein